jgi:hypothetical protein
MGLAIVVLMFLWLFVSPRIGEWILQPLAGFATNLQAPRRFQLSDLIWLMIHLQAVIAMTVQFFTAEVPTGVRVFMLALFSAPVIGIWVVSLHVASRAGITQPLRRGAVILLVIPLGMVSAVAIPVLVAQVVADVLARAEASRLPSAWPSPLWAISLLSAAIMLAAALRVLADWSVGGNSRQVAADAETDTP